MYNLIFNKGLDVLLVSVLLCNRFVVLVVLWLSLLVIDLISLYYFQECFLVFYRKYIIFSVLSLEESCCVYYGSPSGTSSGSSSNNPSGPSGNNSPNNGGGGNNEALVHNDSERRSRSTSSSGSSWSQFSDEVRDDDPPYIKDKKFANCVYEIENNIYADKLRAKPNLSSRLRRELATGIPLDRQKFDNSGKNPLN